MHTEIISTSCLELSQSGQRHTYVITSKVRKQTFRNIQNMPQQPSLITGLILLKDSHHFKRINYFSCGVQYWRFYFGRVLQVAGCDLHSFIFIMYSFSLCESTHMYLSILLLRDTWVVFGVQISWIMLLGVSWYMSWWSCSFVEYGPNTEIAWPWGVYWFNLRRSC